MSGLVNIIVFVCLAVAAVPSALFAVAISEAWMEVYTYPNYDRADGVAYTSDGGCVAVGTSWNVDNNDLSVVRIDKNGNQIWRKMYGGSGSEVATSVKQLSGGGFIVAGYTTSYGPGDMDYYLLRLDANGDTLWTKRYGGANNDQAYYVEVTPDDGYAVFGDTYSYGAGMNDPWLVRTDSNGDTLWTKTYGTFNYEWGYCVRNTNDGGLVMAGATGPFGTLEAFLTKVNSSGTVIWSKVYGGGGDEYGRFVEPLWSGEYMLTGYTTSFGDPDGDALVVRTYSNGDSVWMRTYGGDDYDYGHGIKQMDDSLFIVVIETMDFGASWTDAYVFTMDLTGVELTGATYGGMGDEWFNDIDGSFQYGYVVAGVSNSYSASEDYWVLKTLGTSPTLESVTDVANDQGRQARVKWYRSWYDEPDAGVSVTGYSVWRRYEPALTGGRAGGTVESDFPRLGYPPGDWDYVTSVPARGEDFYSVVVPTLCDSTAGGMCRSHFFVSAETSDPFTYFDSRPDSGYSVDNLAPGPPEGLHMMSATELAWDEAPEADFDYFAVYGSDDGDFGGAAFIGYTIDIYMDVSSDTYGFYHVTATDFAGNEGEPATAENDFAGVRTDVLPGAYALRQNSPNPFAASTSICFDLPERSHVRIEVIDVGGRVVRTLVEETRPAERHYVNWDGRGETGAPVGPGIYFVRMRAGGFSATRKMMLLR